MDILFWIIGAIGVLAAGAFAYCKIGMYLICTVVERYM